MDKILLVKKDDVSLLSLRLIIRKDTKRLQLLLKDKE
jgi:hypothetical protein